MAYKIILYKGKEKIIQMHQPWIYSKAVDRIEKISEENDTLLCLVYDYQLNLLGIGFYNPNKNAAISVRLFYWNINFHLSNDFVISEDFLISLFTERLKQANSLRQELKKEDSNSYRLVNSEGDFFPGLVIDLYNQGIVVQFHSSGFYYYRNILFSIINKIFQPAFIYQLIGHQYKALEQMNDACDGLIHGELPEYVEIEENNVFFNLDIRKSQKSGFYLDQKENRLRVQDFAKNKKVLDMFCYSGGFGLNAIRGGAESVIFVDISQSSLERAKNNLMLNHQKNPSVFTKEICDNCQFLKIDAFMTEETLSALTKSVDLIIVDPPKFATHPKDLPKATRGYKEVNMQAFRLAAPGAFIFSFSCSQAISPVLFRQIIYGAAADAQKKIQVLQTFTQAADHPADLAHPQGEYLTGLLLRLTE